MIVELKAVPTSPECVTEQVTVGPDWIVKEQLVEVTWFASVTMTAKVPGAVAVPVMAPFEVFSVRPAGSVPTTENVYGAVPPVTVIAGLLNTAPTSPVVTAEQVRTGAEAMVKVQLVEETWLASVTTM